MSIKVSFVKGDKVSSGLAVVPVFEGEGLLGAGKVYEKDSKGGVKAALKAAGFTGAKGEWVPVSGGE